MPQVPLTRPVMVNVGTVLPGAIPATASRTPIAPVNANMGFPNMPSIIPQAVLKPATTIAYNKMPGKPQSVLAVEKTPPPQTKSGGLETSFKSLLPTASVMLGTWLLTGKMKNKNHRLLITGGAGVAMFLLAKNAPQLNDIGTDPNLFLPGQAPNLNLPSFKPQVNEDADHPSNRPSFLSPGAVQNIFAQLGKIKRPQNTPPPVAPQSPPMSPMLPAVGVAIASMLFTRKMSMPISLGIAVAAGYGTYAVMKNKTV